MTPSGQLETPPSTNTESDGLPEIPASALHVYALPMTEKFRGITVREGVLVEGPRGWGDFCPFTEYDDADAATWLATAVEAAWHGWPSPVREHVPVNAIVPAVSPERAHELVLRSGCRTAKVKVADAAGSLGADADRVVAVRDALGPGGHVRVDANGRWTVEEAVRALEVLDGAAEGLQYAEQPCASVAELAEVRRRSHVRIAADESIRRAGDPLAVARARAADVAVLKCTPLGGVRRSLALVAQVEAIAELPVVVSSALETSVGLAAELALAGALPRLELACGVGTLALLAGDVVAEPVALVDGALPVPACPPAPDPALLARWEQRDPARRRWW
ncbi:MAG TPA: o-succinylbenzoate synthase, partial [Kineosporiaceae bacterium]|nr:o-succinylbenzoate synthase [Kineosporiaceae bacterium]